MLAPRRPNTPVQVLDHQETNRNSSKTSEKGNVEGRESLVVAGGQRRGEQAEILKESHSTASIIRQEQPTPTPKAFSALYLPNASRTTFTVAIQPTPSPVLRPDGGAKVEVESLPGQNQNKPTLDDAKLDAPVLPGVNQDTSEMGELPNPVSPAAAPDPSQLLGAPAITVNKPLPGQNQEDPIMGEAAPPSAPKISAPASSLPISTHPPLMPSVTSQTSASFLSSVASPSSVQAFSTSLLPSVSVASIQSPTVISSSWLSTSSVNSFTTITRSEQGKKEAPVTLALSSTSSTATMNISSISADATNLAATQAIIAAQSITGLIASTTATPVPTALSTSTQDGSILHPTTRTLLVLFVILGVLSILVAIVISMMVRSQRRRAQAPQQAPYDAFNDRIGVTTHISADFNDNSFLTASEKAIIDRAASPDTGTDMNNSSRLSDAISSFIKKSRRQTYKISP